MHFIEICKIHVHVSPFNWTYDVKTTRRLSMIYIFAHPDTHPCVQRNKSKICDHFLFPWSIMSCQICCESFHGKGDICAVSCGHVFHTACVSRWLIEKKECPNCRQKVIKFHVFKLLNSIFDRFGRCHTVYLNLAAFIYFDNWFHNIFRQLLARCSRFTLETQKIVVHREIVVNCRESWMMPEPSCWKFVMQSNNKRFDFGLFLNYYVHTRSGKHPIYRKKYTTPPVTYEQVSVNQMQFYFCNP